MQPTATNTRGKTARPPARDDALRTLVARRVRDLRGERQAAVRGDVEGVHRMRVASRRLRELLPLLRPSGESSDALRDYYRLVRRSVRRITRALGAVREADVTLGLLDSLEHSHPHLASAAAAVREVVCWQREQSRADMLARLEKADFTRLRRQLTALSTAVEATAPPAAVRRRIGERVARRADRLEAAIEAAGVIYAPARLHAVRIATKQLRYALELAHELGHVPTARSLRTLKRMQDLLGDMHDLEVLRGHTRLLDLQAATRPRRRTQLVALLNVLEEELRRRFARYQAEVPRLMGVAGDCRARCGPRLVRDVAVRRVRPPGG